VHIFPQLNNKYFQVDVNPQRMKKKKQKKHYIPLIIQTGGQKIPITKTAMESWRSFPSIKVPIACIVLSLCQIFIKKSGV
jgi:hypothetical protein